MKTVLLRLFVGLGFSMVTGLLLGGFHMLSPALDASMEEAIIFNADNASTFGEESDFLTRLHLDVIERGGQGARASLQVDGVSQHVRLGEVILPPCLRLGPILTDGVLIDHCGSYAILTLARQGPASAAMNFVLAESGSKVFQPPRVVDLRADLQLRARINDYRQRLYKRPLSLLGAVSIDVRVGEDKSKAYYLSPGRDKLLFEGLGLQAGDRIRAVNGINLANAEALTDIYEDLLGANYLAVTLERSHRDLVILLAF
jgi:general secretion pathway protein C